MMMAIQMDVGYNDHDNDDAADGDDDSDGANWYLLPIHFGGTWIPWRNSVRALQPVLRITAS